MVIRRDEQTCCSMRCMMKRAAMAAARRRGTAADTGLRFNGPGAEFPLATENYASGWVQRHGRARHRLESASLRLLLRQEGSQVLGATCIVAIVNWDDDRLVHAF
jgi:hypothetical protein